MLFAGVLALGIPGYQEWLILLVIGLVIFGRRLPEVGRKLGKTVVQLRKGIQDFKDQIRDDDELREAQATVHELKKAVDLPRSVASPKRMLDKFAEDALREEQEAEAKAEPQAETGEGSDTRGSSAE